MADRPLVEGEICATIDLRRSVMSAVRRDVCAVVTRRRGRRGRRETPQIDQRKKDDVERHAEAESGDL
jgi:hypothetical protein